MLLIEQQLLGRLDRDEDRRPAFGILIDANAEVDLVRTAIGREHADQRKQRIGWLGLQEIPDPAMWGKAIGLMLRGNRNGDHRFFLRREFTSSIVRIAFQNCAV